MISSDALFRQCAKKLEEVYGKEEAQSLAFLLLEHFFSLSRAAILARKQIVLSEKVEVINQYIERLNQQEPIQYLLGKTVFYEHEFEVNPAVLIPRPETEELVQLIISENKGENPFSILDIGTGSGCIAISLKKGLPAATVFAIDVSEDALAVAKKNALSNDVKIEFLHQDILAASAIVPSTNIIVSNPPYILESEKRWMSKNVLEHEPFLALFVEDQDPLLFYKAILEKAQKYLLPRGKIYFEINENFGKETAQLLVEGGFTEVSIRKDLNGKERIVKGMKQN
ncbi:MAG TPA: peptide chain release factor N(5)-glutamine methyltransferase [Cytophagaceae bacterium]|jgi:release factor glutamine methyltransferase|nr:peptide chain release factor N(5)-glutamine methyltransferase [Cytophagaceae bacterium]